MGDDLGRVLAIDLGRKRIGLAMCDPLRIIASPHSVLKRTATIAEDHRNIAQVVEECDVVRVIVGLPYSLDGTEGAAAKEALAETRKLSDTLQVPVESYDERLTTVTAHRLLESSGQDSRDRRERVDAAAAAVMLQSWMDGQGTPPPEHPHERR